MTHVRTEEIAVMVHRVQPTEGFEKMSGPQGLWRQESRPSSSGVGERVVPRAVPSHLRCPELCVFDVIERVRLASDDACG